MCTSAVCPSSRMVSIIPRAVSGLMKLDAPSAAVVPAGSGRHCSTLTQRNCEYIPPPRTATTLPRRAWAAGDDPALTTTPAPSLPAGIDWSTRPAMALISFSGMLAVTTELSAEPDTRAVLMSAAPKRSPRSEGLIGAASTRTTTSSGPGPGVGTRRRESSSVPVDFTRDRSCSPLAASLGVTGSFIARAPAAAISRGLTIRKASRSIRSAGPRPVHRGLPASPGRAAIEAARGFRPRSGAIARRALTQRALLAERRRRISRLHVPGIGRKHPHGTALALEGRNPQRQGAP